MACISNVYLKLPAVDRMLMSLSIQLHRGASAILLLTAGCSRRGCDAIVMGPPLQPVVVMRIGETRQFTERWGIDAVLEVILLLAQLQAQQCGVCMDAAAEP